MKLVVMYFDIYHMMRSYILGVLNFKFKVFHYILCFDQSLEDLSSLISQHWPSHRGS